ncbi:MAG: hypothetical protein JRI55_32535 [Deltaproteobacteria bacterium]|jgi:hypothetical protein|nr:hypothetical protein [Deltaproteobacteria bacterium]
MVVAAAEPDGAVVLAGCDGGDSCKDLVGKVLFPEAARAVGLSKADASGVRTFEVMAPGDPKGTTCVAPKAWRIRAVPTKDGLRIEKRGTVVGESYPASDGACWQDAARAFLANKPCNKLEVVILASE